MNRGDYFSFSQLGLPNDVWQPLVTSGAPLPYQAGQMIYLQGSTATHFYLIVSGQVRTYISDADGTERLLTVYHPGNLFGEASFFDQLPRVSSAMALTDCRIIPIDWGMMQECISQSPELAIAMLKYLARTVRLLSAQVDDLSFAKADQRLARVLSSLSAEQDTLQLSQEELADTIGASRVTVSRVLRRFSQAGWVTLGYRSVAVHNREALLALCES